MSAPEEFLGGRVRLIAGDCRAAVAGLAAGSIDAVVTDPPYALASIARRFGKAGAKPPGDKAAFARAAAGFMGQAWDTGEVAFDAGFWADVLRVLKPGAHLVATGGTRTYHRLASAIEDAGFEIRDQLAWTYGTGFPKSHDVSKGIDRAAGAERETTAVGKAVKRMIPGADQHRQGWEKTDGRVYVPNQSAPAAPEAANWEGWGTALKPAWEPIVLARKPIDGTVAETVLRHGTGALNIDGCRVGGAEDQDNRRANKGGGMGFSGGSAAMGVGRNLAGRHPANLLHDGSDEVLSSFPDAKGGADQGRRGGAGGLNGALGPIAARDRTAGIDDSGSAARFFASFPFSGDDRRFFYSAKADSDDRIGSNHPTVKPVDLMRWLCRLVTPLGGVVLDPFAGTGTTGEAAWREGFSAVLIERDSKYRVDVARRMALVEDGPETRRLMAAKARGRPEKPAPLFDLEWLEEGEL